MIKLQKDRAKLSRGYSKKFLDLIDNFEMELYALEMINERLSSLATQARQNNGEMSLSGDALNDLSGATLACLLNLRRVIAKTN